MAKHKIIDKVAFHKLGFTTADIDGLEELIYRGGSQQEYRQACLDFVLGLAERDIDELTPRQVGWATKIKDMLDDQRRKGHL